MIIQRPAEVGRLNGTAKWMLVYGRRKTGKSFLVENFTAYDGYYFVKKDRTIISKKDSRDIAYAAFLELVFSALADGKTVVVDEFHRLGGDFFDRLHASKKSGRLVLISSTLHMSHSLIGQKSALLGLLAEVPVWLVGTQDCIRALDGRGLQNKELVELALMLKEPLAIEHFGEGKGARGQFASVLSYSAKAVPALVGEIFTEEERAASAVYEGILRAVANGHVVSGEISSYLFSRRLIAKDSPGPLQQYLKNLVDFGLLRRVEVLGRNKFIYKHVSPLCRLFYYADEKYNLGEREPAKDEVLRIIDVLLPRMVEDEVRSLAAAKYGLAEAVSEGRDYDVDACLMKFRRVEIAMEVKWKGRVGEADVRRAEESLAKIDAREKWLFVPDRKMVKVKTTLKVIDILDLAQSG